ncbi:hypothetical protein FXB38_16115 [Bradyrhizobium cytisi]|uniref:Uncharacterized protein n=1 Tax=Bradyrhizobium cytisi TaxID=515489 RepID=A0A5S4WQX8_9BRAD|nr:hypothetical protein FXB38_16115 [Bradyrhizobium cytisi]
MIVGLAESPPHPKFKQRLNFDLSPQAGRGEVCRDRQICPSQKHVLMHPYRRRTGAPTHFLPLAAICPYFAALTRFI